MFRFQSMYALFLDAIGQRHGSGMVGKPNPVWILNTTWNGEKYRFAMNGQTGKFVGNLPLDKGAYIKWLLGLTASISAAVFAVFYLLWLL